MNKSQKIAVIGLVIFVAVILIASIGFKTGNGSGPDLSSTSGASSTHTDNIAAHWADIKYGMSKQQVIAILGSPNDSQHMESQGYSDDCIYYGDPITTTTSYQFCFTNGSLESKNQY